MKRCFLSIFILFTCLLVTAQDGRFGLYFEQNGQRYDVIKNEVTLKAAPFDLVLVFPAPMGVLINASLEPFTYGPVTKKKSKKKKEELIGFANTGMAEENFNPGNDIMITDNAPSYWYYDSATAHRFSQVILTDSGYVCKRHIESLAFIGDKKKEKIEGNMPALFLVLMSTMWTKDMREIELMRAAVKVNWVR